MGALKLASGPPLDDLEESDSSLESFRVRSILALPKLVVSPLTFRYSALFAARILREDFQKLAPLVLSLSIRG